MSELDEIVTVIKERRKLLGVNQEDLAHIAGISVRRLKAVESGVANPSFALLLKILGALGMTLRVGTKP